MSFEAESKWLFNALRSLKKMDELLLVLRLYGTFGWAQN